MLHTHKDRLGDISFIPEGKIIFKVHSCEEVKNHEVNVSVEDLPFADRVDPIKQIDREKKVVEELTKHELKHMQCQGGLFGNPVRLISENGRPVDRMLGETRENEGLLQKNFDMDSMSLHFEISRDVRNGNKLAELLLILPILDEMNDGEVYIHAPSDRAWLKINGEFFYNSDPAGKRTWGVVKQGRYEDLLQTSQDTFVKGILLSDKYFESEDGTLYDTQSGKER